MVSGLYSDNLFYRKTGLGSGLVQFSWVHIYYFSTNSNPNSRCVLICARPLSWPLTLRAIHFNAFYSAPQELTFLITDYSRRGPNFQPSSITHSYRWAVLAMSDPSEDLSSRSSSTLMQKNISRSCFYNTTCYCVIFCSDYLDWFTAGVPFNQISLDHVRVK